MKNTIATMVLLLAGLSPAMADSQRMTLANNADNYEVAFAGCGWYIVLGCSSNFNSARNTLNNLGGPFAGGGAGLKVANTSEYPNFRNGFYCVLDGPYNSQSAAQSVAWNEAVRDAYVKNGC